MGTSSGLIHHYFDSMDDVLAAAFEQVARQDLDASARLIGEASDPVDAIRVFFQTYTPADKDWTIQLWLDAWAEAARRPALQATSRRLNREWQGLLVRTIRDGRRDRSFSCADPAAAAWRILSVLDGLALQVVAHATTISRDGRRALGDRRRRGRAGGVHGYVERSRSGRPGERDVTDVPQGHSATTPRWGAVRRAWQRAARLTGGRPAVIWRGSATSDAAVIVGILPRRGPPDGTRAAMDRGWPTIRPRSRRSRVMTSPATTPATTAASTLYFGPWYRRSPFFEKTLEAGCSAYDIYNHMYLPGYYADPIEEYWALLNDVTVWDVAVERIVEITGPDASAFTNSLTCRDLTTCAVGQGKYMIVTAEDGGIVNDPVLLRVEADRWWMALADSDAGLWARGVAIHTGLDVTVREPEVYPIQVQGPKSRDTMRTVFGPPIDDIKYYWTLTTEVDGIPVVISRTGWTGEVGYEIYLRDPSRGGDLWDRVMEAGKPHKIRPIAPCEARRIEAGIFNYGSDIYDQRHAVPRHGPGTTGGDPGRRLHRQGGARGHPREPASIASSSASRSRATPCRSSSRASATRSMTGSRSGPSRISSGRRGSRRTSATCGCRSDWLAPGTPLEIVAPDGGTWSARSADIPFIDPKKEVPLG